jgi:hypothetical protein
MAKQTRFRMPESVQLPVNLIYRLEAASIIAAETDIFQNQGYELLKVINEIVALRPFPVNNYIQFWALFEQEKDCQYVVDWLFENNYTDETGKWKGDRAKYFSWVLQHLHEQGWTHSFPADKARQIMAEKSFKINIGLTTIKKIIGDSGEGIKPNPSKKTRTTLGH